MEEPALDDLTLPEEVARTIEELFPSSDPLERLDFDPTEYLNENFPSQQSLSTLDDVVASARERIARLDIEISDVVRGMNAVEAEGQEALTDAQQVILQLTGRIREMKEQAVRSEQMVNDITADIKQLDHAKKNLTASIILLNNLHILVDGVDKLQDLMEARNYGQTASTLHTCLDVLFQLDRHQHVPHVRDLASKVDSIRSKLSTQIIADFHEILEGSKSSFQQNQLRQLAEACLVVDCLDSKVKNELLEWIVRRELEEYKVLFQENQDISWLDKVDKRFAWLKKHLIHFEDRFGRIFPPKWEVSERIAVEFCKHTSKELSKVMSNRSYEINVRNLLFAVSKSTAFENLLSQRFPGLTITAEDVPSNKKKEFEQGKIRNPFISLVSHCFEPYLSIYVEAQDKNLQQMIDQFADEVAKKDPSHVSSTSSSEVFPSAGILFTQYKNSLVQCVQLSTGQPLLLLAQVFQRNLREYASRVLQGSLPRLGGSAISLSLLPSLTNVSSSQVRSTASAAAELFQSLLKDETNKLTRADIVTTCSVILTANYCLETSQQLEKKLREKIDDHLKTSISLTTEQDIFHSLTCSSIQLLVSNFEAVCEPSFSQMVKTQWSTADTPIGPSPYVVSMTAELQRNFPLVRENLSEALKFFTQVSNRFAESFSPKFISNLFKCRGVSQGGAEQLLLDTHTLKKSLLELPTHESVVKSAPQTYSKSIVKGMTKAESILKVVLVPHDKIDAFIESYLKLLPDSETSEFMKILDMKGIVKKTESQNLLDVFRVKSLEKRQEGLTKLGSLLMNGSEKASNSHSKSPDNQTDSNMTSFSATTNVTDSTDSRSTRMEKLFSKPKK